MLRWDGPQVTQHCSSLYMLDKKKKSHANVTTQHFVSVLPVSVNRSIKTKTV